MTAFPDFTQVPLQPGNQPPQGGNGYAAWAERFRKETGKSPQVVEKIVAGKIEKFLNEVTLLGQPFVKATDKTPVAQILADAKVTVRGFERFEVGEGIQKKADTFAAEVMAAARGE